MCYFLLTKKAVNATKFKSPLFCKIMHYFSLGKEQNKIFFFNVNFMKDNLAKKEFEELLRSSISPSLLKEKVTKVK